MRTYSMNDAQYPYEYEAYAIKNIRVGNAETKSSRRKYQETPLDIAATMRRLRVDLKSYREDNKMMIKS